MSRSSLPPTLYAVSAAAVFVAYMLLSQGEVTEWIAVGGGAAAAATVFGATWVRRPLRPVPWLLFGAGLVGLAAAAVMRMNDHVGRGTPVFPDSAEAISVLAYPALFVGTISLTSRRQHTRDLLGGSEPIIYAIVFTALAWVGVSGPFFEDGKLPMTSDTWVWVLPLLDAALALIAARRAVGAVADHAGRPVFGTMTLGFLALGAAHLITGWAHRDGELTLGTPLAATLLVGPLLLGLVAVLPPISSASEDAVSSLRMHWAQIFGLLFASLVPLGASIVMLATGLSSPTSFVVVSAATVSVIALALGRMWHLVDEVRRLTELRGQAKLAAMVEHSSDVVMLADVDGRVSYASPGLRSTLGHDPEGWVGRHLVDVVGDDDRDAALRAFEGLAAAEPGGTVEFEATLTHAHGQPRKAAVVMSNLIGASAVDGIVATFRDVTEQRNLERQLSHRAFHDELTGLANRALFLDRMDHALRVTRPATDPVVVLFVDLDDFKSVNDALGHAVGDQLLKTVSDRIRQSTGSGDTAARLGGDEFAVLLEDRGGIDRALDVAERLLDSLREPVPIAGYDVAVLASVGVAVATDGMSTTSLLRDADIAMYEAKRAGKGQIRIFDPAMRLVATKHLEYRTELGNALDNDELRLVYMPYVDLQSGQVTGAEALVRWHHPEHGDLPANEFIPIAERSGLIVPMGYWILDEALRQVSAWRPGLYVSINVSAVQIRQPEFVERVIDAADQHRVDPSMIVFELPETVMVDEADRATDAMRRLRDEGFRFAIDDFGLGYCSLRHLQRHPVDLLKIARSLIDDFGADPHGDTLARTILQMASSLNLLAVAEGIETSAQLRELRRLGCDLGQGYLLSHPLETETVALRFGRVDPAVVG